MNKKWLWGLLPLLVCGLILLWFWVPTFELAPQPTELAENAMPGAVFSMTADRQKAVLTASYTGTEDYLVIDPWEQWFQVYKLEPDGWHSIQNTRFLPLLSTPVGPGTEEDFSFTWRLLLGSPLSAGQYRLKVCYGDSHLMPAYWYHSFVDFTIG